MASPARFVLIPCKVTEGMFSNEVAVEIEVENTTVSLFVDQELIVKKGDQTYLRVNAAGENGKPENQTVLLPSESFETGSRWLSVPNHVLQVA